MSEQPEVSVLFADLAGYTALTEAHGDAGAANVAERFYELTRQSLSGTTRFVKPIGDAVMLAGPDASAVLDSLLHLCARVEAEPDYPALRAGLHVGPVVEREGDLFGATVNVAARVAAHARAGQSLCTARFRAALRERADLVFAPLGAVKLKNVLEPVELCEIAPAPTPSVEFALDPVCRMRVARAGCLFTCEARGSTRHFCSATCRDAFLAGPERYLEELG